MGDIGLVCGNDVCIESPKLLHKFLQTLSDADRALILMYLEDMSGTEMAQIFGISAGALRVRIHRIKQRLAKWEIGDV